MKTTAPNLVTKNWDIVGPYLHCRADYGDALVYYYKDKRILARCAEEAKAAVDTEYNKQQEEESLL